MATTYEVPVFIWGGSMAGIVAGVAVTRQGVTARGAEMMPYTGGLVTGGLGLPDYVGTTDWGITTEFFLAVEAAAIADGAVEDTGNLDADGVQIGYGRHPNGLIRRYAPDWARTARDALIAGTSGDLVFDVDCEIAAVDKDPDTKRITAVTLTNGDVYLPQNCIDASYELDLARHAGVPITYGRESVGTYNEYNAGYVSRFQSTNAGRLVSTRGDTWKWYTHPPIGMVEGQADYKQQADDWRMTLSTESGRLGFDPPPGFVLADFASFIDEMNARARNNIENITSYQSMTAELHTTNGDDWPGASWRYQRLKTKAERQRYVAEMYYRHAGQMHVCSTSLAVPGALRTSVLAHGLPQFHNAVEYYGQPGWSAHPYIRSTPRIIGRKTLTFAGMIEPGRLSAARPIALGGYNVDFHTTNFYASATRGFVNEGHTEDDGRGIYSIELDHVLPALGACSNLAVVQGPSISYIAQGSDRMEPTFMVTAEAVGVAAALATTLGLPIGQVPYGRLRQALDDLGAELVPAS